MKQKRIFMIMILVIGILLIPGKNNAVLQANPNTHGAKADSPTSWMTNIRNMEAANQAMGLNETVDATTKKATSASNGIDVHMIKTTEYGGVAILSASGYGNPNWIQNSEIKSTTGNKSGVYFVLGNTWEWTAGGLSGSAFSGVDGKYYDAYTGSAKVGDALGTSTAANPGCAKWHGGDNNVWVNSTYPYFRRGQSSVFNFNNYKSNDTYLCRAVVVCGAGF